MARRVRFFDSLRGLSVLSMVGFHLCYDLRYLAGLSLPWFQGTFQDVWRATISWVFLFLAGVMSSYSRNNYRRAAKYGLFALAIFAVTAIVAVDDAISFGIIFCMAACTLVTAILETLRIRPGGLVAGAACVAAFLCAAARTLRLPRPWFHADDPTTRALCDPLALLAWVPRSGICFGRLLPGSPLPAHVPCWRQRRPLAEGLLLQRPCQRPWP